MSSNNRQKRYRKRRGEAGDVRLDIWVGCGCNDALKRVSDASALPFGNRLKGWFLRLVR